MIITYPSTEAEVFAPVPGNLVGLTGDAAFRLELDRGWLGGSVTSEVVAAQGRCRDLRSADPAVAQRFAVADLLPVGAFPAPISGESRIEARRAFARSIAANCGATPYPSKPVAPRM